MIKNFILFILVSVYFITFLSNIKYIFFNKTISYNNFIKLLNNNYIKKIYLEGNKIFILNKNNKKYITYIPNICKELTEILLKNKVDILNKNYILNSNYIIYYLMYVIPILIFLIIWLILIKKINIKNLFLGKNNVKNNIKTKFCNIAGCDEAKEEIKEIVNFLKNPDKYKKLGGKIPKGILLIGEPGTGKTLLAKAIAGESNVPFYNISGSEFVEMFVGVGALRVREIFDKAKKNSPSIIFIDEIDSIGRQRGIGLGGSHDEREQTLNQMLVEMDGFTENESVIVIAATNRPEILDKALLRSGRFDRKIIIDLPNLKGREDILKIYIKKTNISKDVNIKEIAKTTYGFSGADLFNLVNESILNAVKNNRNIISMKDFDISIDRILLGIEKKNLFTNINQKESVAYHESGHVIVGKIISNQHINKVTIIPRGNSLGYTMCIEDENLLNLNKEILENKISILYAGRIAEEIIYGSEKVSTGCFNDIKTATNIAKNMILKWGYSDKLSPIIFNENDMWNRKILFSNRILDLINNEIFDIINRNIIRSKKILLKNIDLLHNMKNLLLKYETLYFEQINDIINRKFL
ncbi:ATP-dependent zinc metalloprotease FtsH [Candidatus Nardonella dryophthoridicola]|uniref:ATP-dependent zinc metalloprotease FtsH n=1 Tax=Candidatus Nardonella dryophthoridicola TaxID=1971485 RepID=UPI001AD86265|nr:ATP-dependent zinc metalloprotease FtsH [Candidatus Nardonella dryophthoridicola]QTJ62944.1 ATP-dependent zinc metalloprotease FtsH [Candidatus Nardonella dryophthoridicola]